MLGQLQARLLKLPALWLVEHSLSLLRARGRKRTLILRLQATILCAQIILYLCNLTGVSGTVRMSKFNATGQDETHISPLGDFTRCRGKTYYQIVDRGPGYGGTSRAIIRCFFLITLHELVHRLERIHHQVWLELTWINVKTPKPHL